MKLELWLRTALLLAFLTVIFVGIGYILAGIWGAVFALFIAFILDFVSFWYSDKIVLSMYGAKPCEDSEVNAMVEKLALKAGIPKPRVYVCELEIPNAFATGRSPKHAAICVTQGLLRLLNKEEIEGVLSHEIAHIKNRDVLISTIAAVIAGAISFLAQFGWYALYGDENERSLLLIPLLIFAPLAAFLVQLAISRGREFLADYTGALISGKPLALASALRKISSFAHTSEMERVNPGTAHMFIVNPFSTSSFENLFSKHPPVEERIRRLEELSRKN